MKCPKCLDKELVEVITENGILIDYCPVCQGIWLDKGEIYYFTKNQVGLWKKLEKALEDPKPSERLNPKTSGQMVELRLYSGNLVIDYDMKTGGIWLDRGELEKITDTKEAKIRLRVDKTMEKPAVAGKKTNIPLPSVGISSCMLLLLMYLLLAVILMIPVYFNLFDAAIALIIGLAFAVLQFILSPFIMDAALKSFYKVKWLKLEELPVHLQEFVKKVCEKNKINVPKVGVIYDGSPNAFTYGHSSGNARVVLTTGMMKLLSPDELEAVFAHEIGHVLSWDLLVMTIVNLAPLVYYHWFKSLMKIKAGKDKVAFYKYAPALVFYILYAVSEYIVVNFSRAREYNADRFAGKEGKDPVFMASALMKIGYGMAGKQTKAEFEKVEFNFKAVTLDRKPQFEAIKGMGIFDQAYARALAVTSFNPDYMGGEIDKEDLKGALRWELWNPWAKFYELNSTHPLVAKRLIALNRQAEAIGKPPYIAFDDRRPESYWDEFLWDVLVSLSPLISIVVIIAAFILNGGNSTVLKAGAILLGLVYILKTAFLYKSNYYAETNINSLLKAIKVSGIRPIPCQIEGKVIGRGGAGLVWSEDFVLQDAEGIIFLDYKQPLAVWNSLFGAIVTETFTWKDAIVTGWYRRSPVPYIEIRSIEVGDKKSYSYVLPVKLTIGFFLIMGGVIAFMMPMIMQWVR